LPSRFIAGSSAGFFPLVRWIVPALCVVLFVGLLVAAPHGRLGRFFPKDRRPLAIAVIAVLSVANGIAIVLLVHLLVAGATTNARLLLRAAIHMWCMNVLVFALWYWLLDSGGPRKRRVEVEVLPDFLFPQQTLGVAGWRPIFVDYLYTSFTSATAFSPTDTMPLSRWAKMLMLVQSASSLLLAIMVAARAVNILK
jgi:uncharacterized membrane protein